MKMYEQRIAVSYKPIDLIDNQFQQDLKTRINLAQFDVRAKIIPILSPVTQHCCFEF